MDADNKHIPHCVRQDIAFHTLNKRALPSHKPIFITKTLKNSTEHCFVNFLDMSHN